MGVGRSMAGWWEAIANGGDGGWEVIEKCVGSEWEEN